MIRPPLEDNHDDLRVAGAPPMRQQQLPQKLGQTPIRRMIHRSNSEQEFEGTLPPGASNLCLGLVPSRSTVVVDGRVIRREGDPDGSCVIPGGAQLSGRHYGNAGFIEFRLEADEMPALLLENDLDPNDCELRVEYVPADDMLARRRRQLLFALETVPQLDTLYLDMMLDAALSHLVRRHAVAGRLPRRRRPSLTPVSLRRVCDYIEANVGEALRLEELAEIAHISRAHFARAFRNETGVTPHLYVTHRRLDSAMTMLRRAGVPLAVIASTTGFADHAHLARTFRQQLGVTPSDARHMLAPRRHRAKR